MRLKVSRQVARLVADEAPRDIRLAAARGAMPLSGKDLLTVLFLLCSGKDVEIRQAAVATLKNLPAAIIKPLLAESDLDSHLLELIARIRIMDAELSGPLVAHPKASDATLLYLARNAPPETLERLVNHQVRLEQCPEIRDAIIANPNAARALKFRLGWQDPEEEVTVEGKGAEPDRNGDVDGGDVSDEDNLVVDEEIDGEIIDEDLSKYQLSLGLKVSEKIKLGITGDKEWRSLLMKDANKLVQSAVLKNPRITDGEVIMVAKNKQSSDEMIRLILLNKDWIKLYEIKKALVWHPKTPLPKALRLVGFLTEKDLKEIARSRNVQTVISTQARKEFERKRKKA